MTPRWLLIGRAAGRAAGLPGALALGLAGCGLADAASEIALGKGRVPAVQFSATLPSVDLAASGELGAAGTPGVPTDAAGLTLAHLAGLLRLRGDCAYQGRIDAAADRLRSAEYTIALCDGRDTCGGLCGPGERGAVLGVAARVGVLEKKDVDVLRSKLSEVSTDAIVQIRLRFRTLALTRGAGPEATPLTDALADFRFTVEVDGAPPLQILGRDALDGISPDTPQRYELSPQAELTEALKSHVVGAEPFDLTVEHRFLIREDALADFTLAGTTLTEDIQPEFVISVLEAVSP